MNWEKNKEGLVPIVEEQYLKKERLSLEKENQELVILIVEPTPPTSEIGEQW